MVPGLHFEMSSTNPEFGSVKQQAITWTHAEQNVQKFLAIS